jgi:ATP-dependent phosphoenolpyruvate carboxykinase
MWRSAQEYDRAAAKLAAEFRENQKNFEGGLTPEVEAAAPPGK